MARNYSLQMVFNPKFRFIRNKALASKCVHKISDAHIRLFENASKCSRLYLSVHRYGATTIIASHNDVAASLSDLSKAQLFERSHVR